MLSRFRRWLAEAWQRWRRPLSLGQRGERAAAKYLKRQGFRIVAQGLRTRQGEMDLIAVDGETVVFIEVKTRTSHAAGHPAEAVDEHKQRRMTRFALGYLRRHGLLSYRSRFDVVAVTWPADGQPLIEHLRNAFSPPGEMGY